MPRSDAVPVGELLEIDRYALAQARALADAVEADYARYEFHLVVQRLQTYCSEDLGGFYLDVLKDRLYTTAHGQPRAPLGADGAGAHPRRAAEADGADPLVHRRGSLAHRAIRTMRRSSAAPGTDALPRLPDADALIAKWDADPRRARGRAEGARDAAPAGGKIGSSLQAEVAIGAPDADYEALASPRRRPALRADHVGGDASRRGDALAIDGHAERAREMRALLALARRRRRRRRAPDAVRPLRCEPVRRGRAAPICVTDDAMTSFAPHRRRLGSRWLWLAAGVIVARPADEGVRSSPRFRDGEELAASRSFFSLVLAYNTGAAFSFLARRSAAGSAGSSRRSRSPPRVVIVWLLRRGGSALYCAGLALILGGALGNLCDRLMLGNVVDFLLFHYARMGVSGVQRRRQRDHRRRGAADRRQLPRPRRESRRGGQKER